jgi:hypothetical protein
MASKASLLEEANAGWSKSAWAWAAGLKRATHTASAATNAEGTVRDGPGVKITSSYRDPSAKSGE